MFDVELGSVIIVGLTVFRLTRVVTADTIFEPLRTRMAVATADAGPARRLLFQLVTCFWCVSWWIGLTVGLILFDGDIMGRVVAGLAAAGTAGLLYTVGERS
jgi:hypothetical protein